MNLPQFFLNQHATGTSIVLHDRRHAPLDFYGDVYACCRERVPTLLPGLHYRAEHITGPNFWLKLHPTLAQLAGRCVHDMVERDLLPLTVAWNRSATLRYRRR